MTKRDVFSVPGISGLLEGKVRGRGGPRGAGGSTGREGRLDRNRLERIVSKRAPEVLLKIRRGGKSVGHVQEHLAYISRNGKIEAENERGERIVGRASVRAVGDEWELAPGSARPGLSKTINMILSMPTGTEPEKVRDAARAFARHNLSNHQYLFALHTPETDPDPKAPPHPHVHISILATGFDGKRLNPDKEMLQQWRESFALELRERGVEAEATPRKTRGVVRKAVRSAEWHVERRSKESVSNPKGVASKARAERMQEIADEFRRGERALGSWELKAQESQAKIRKHWLELAAHFKATGLPADVALATDIVSFVNTMPRVETERMAGKRVLDKAARHFDGRKPPLQGKAQEPPKRGGPER